MVATPDCKRKPDKICMHKLDFKVTGGPYEDVGEASEDEVRWIGSYVRLLKLHKQFLMLQTVKQAGNAQRQHAAALQAGVEGGEDIGVFFEDTDEALEDSGSRFVVVPLFYRLENQHAFMKKMSKEQMMLRLQGVETSKMTPIGHNGVVRSKRKYKSKQCF